MRSTPETEWLNLSQAADILGVHPSTLRGWADKGDIPVHRTAGKHRRFLRGEVETWAATRREAQTFSSELIVQSTLGRTRLQMAEGQLNNTPWYPRLEEHHKQAFREAGRQLLTGLMRYLNAESDSALHEAEVVGREYARLGRTTGLSLSANIKLFLLFRDFLYDSVVDVYQASGQRAPREWAEMHRRTTRFTNEVLLALVEAHERQAD